MPAIPEMACGAGIGSFAKANITPTMAPVERERKNSRMLILYRSFDFYNQILTLSSMANILVMSLSSFFGISYRIFHRKNRST